MTLTNQFAPLVLIRNGVAQTILPAARHLAMDTSSYSEAWLQNLVFAHPETIPVQEIEPGFGPLIPICTELDTRQAGYIDTLFANHQGLLTIAEFKLWRNPEARREVVGQILDYARVLRRWTYADLQREVSHTLKRHGANALFDIVRSKHPALDEASFIDAASRNLRNGRFLLLLIGDGIREGVESIAEYVQAHAGLHFTFGLVEIGIYDLGAGQCLIQPRILARTLIVNRSVVELASPELQLAEATEAGEQELDDSQAAFKAFWTELLTDLRLDDPEQPLPKPTTVSNIFFSMPLRAMWVTTYYGRQSKESAVFLGWDKTAPLAVSIIKQLEDQREDINDELATPVSWEVRDSKLRIVAHHAPADPKQMLAWFGTTINTFVNVFRPRIAALMKELGATPA